MELGHLSVPGELTRLRATWGSGSGWEAGHPDANSSTHSRTQLLSPGPLKSTHGDRTLADAASRGPHSPERAQSFGRPYAWLYGDPGAWDSGGHKHKRFL